MHLKQMTEIKLDMLSQIQFACGQIEFMFVHSVN